MAGAAVQEGGAPAAAEADPMESILAELDAEIGAEEAAPAQVEEAAPEVPGTKEAEAAAMAAKEEADASPPPGTETPPWFTKRLEQWKRKDSASAERIKTLEAQFKGATEAGSMKPEELVRLRALADITGKLDSGSKDKPWLAAVLRDLAQGKEPDWAQVELALVGWRKALPTMPPEVQARLAALEQATQGFQDQQTQAMVDAHVRREDAEIGALIQKAVGEDKEEFKALAQLVQDVALASAQRLPAVTKLEELPNRVEIAKRLLALREGAARKALEARLPASEQARRAAVRAGSGAPGPGKDAGQPAPAYGSRAWDKWVDGVAYTAEDEKN